jgi:hypothetical protein
MELVSFGVIGGGWRSEFYLKIAKELPNFFKVTGVVVRNSSKGEELERKWGVKTYRNLDSLIEQTNFSFLVVSVPWSVTPELIVELSNRNIPVLSETPPAPDLERLIELNQQINPNAKVQVAEQYPFQPANAAILSLIGMGILGTITHTQVSLAHGYHGISMLRKLLGITNNIATIKAIKFSSPIIEGPNRKGIPEKELTIESEQVIASFSFEEKLGIYDFTDDQYFSWIRAPRLLVRGEKGEIYNQHIRYLTDFRTPVEVELKRVNAGENGNLEGYYLKGISAGDKWIYQNPFIPGRLTDDELAVATCLEKMSDYVRGGPSFYSLSEASQDQYLSLMLNKAVETNQCITTSIYEWGK